jgi:hypothetical protein
MALHILASREHLHRLRSKRRLLYNLCGPHYKFFFFIWLYSPILDLGRLHETFRFISVTRSRTVSRTPWTGDQLVARPLRVCPE